MTQVQARATVPPPIIVDDATFDVVMVVLHAPGRVLIADLSLQIAAALADNPDRDVYILIERRAVKKPSKPKPQPHPNPSGHPYPTR